VSTPTPNFEYSPTHFSEKFVFPWRLIISIQSNGGNGGGRQRCRSGGSARADNNQPKSGSKDVQHITLNVIFEQESSVKLVLT
jgi:hypothetical protein